MDVETLRGIAVVSLTEGLRLGRIDEVLFSTQPLQVRAWQVRADDGLFVIPIDQVRSVGTDAIIVESSQVTHAAGGAGASTPWSAPLISSTGRWSTTPGRSSA